MNASVLKNLTFSFVFLLLMQLTSAQQDFYTNPLFGHDSISRKACVMNSSLYREYVKQRNYVDALGPWYEVFHNCPKASKNIYIDGVKIFRSKIRKEIDPVKKEEHIDTLMKVYEQRIVHFPKREGFVLGRQGVDLLKYRGDRIDEAKRADEIIKRSIDLQKNRSEAAVLLAYMTTTEILFKNAVIQNDKVIDNYALITDILDIQEENARTKKAKETVDAIFERSGAGTCEGLVALFQPKFDATPDDIKLLEQIIGLMKKAPDCEEAELYFNAIVKLYELQPNAESAILVAEMSVMREEIANAMKYYNEAIELDENKENKALYYLEIANIYRKQDKFKDAKNYARKAIGENPNNGQAYLLIGHLYSASGNLCKIDELQKTAVYWAAVDKYSKAKAVDPSLADEANKYVKTYTAYFPKKETLFFYGVKAGDVYKLGCWINESTTVRIND